MFASIVGMVVLAATLLMAYYTYQALEDIFLSVLMSAVAYGFLAVGAYGITLVHAEAANTPAPYHEVFTHFGLESGKEYPLELGSRFAGSSGQLEVSGGLFYTTGSESWNPATGVSVGFDSKDGRSAILEIPNSRVVYVKDPDATPSLRIDINPEATHQGSNTPLITKGRGPCHAEFRGAWVCIPEYPDVALRVPELAERAGIGPVASEAFAESAATATITLTPEQYDALLKQG